jgi:hypothetical protein
LLLEHFVVAHRHGFIFSFLFILKFKLKPASVLLKIFVRGDKKLAGKLVTVSFASLKKGSGARTRSQLNSPRWELLAMLTCQNKQNGITQRTEENKNYVVLNGCLSLLKSFRLWWAQFGYWLLSCGKPFFSSFSVGNSRRRGGERSAREKHPNVFKIKYCAMRPSQAATIKANLPCKRCWNKKKTISLLLLLLLLNFS